MVLGGGAVSYERGTPVVHSVWLGREGLSVEVVGDDRVEGDGEGCAGSDPDQHCDLPRPSHANQ